MAMKAEGKILAILAADGFEESELFSPKAAIEAAGGRAEVISLKPGDIQGLRHMEKGRSIHVDKTLDEADAEDYDAILIPGGLFNPDRLRTEKDALKFAGAFVKHRKPVFAICHGPQVLISAGLALFIVPKIPFLGKLPGDILLKKEHFTFYFPLATSILISILISLILYLIGKFR